MEGGGRKYSIFFSFDKVRNECIIAWPELFSKYLGVAISGLSRVGTGCGVTNIRRAFACVSSQLLVCTHVAFRPNDGQLSNLFTIFLSI